MNLINGDSLIELKKLPENSVDSIVTDPPYGLSFMGKKWDYDVPSIELWKEAIRVLKPGGHLLSFGGSRTYHRMAVNIEDAGFEIRDQIMWVYGSGFPKSHNIGKAVDKITRGNRVVELIDALLEEGHTLKELGDKAGIPSLESSYRDWTTDHNPEERSWDRLLNGLGFSEEDGLNIVEKRKVKLGGGNAYTFREGEARESTINITKGTSPYEGWGTALKPAHETIVVARKPLSESTIAENVLKWGCGGINIDACRIPANWKEERPESWFNSGKSKSGEATYGGNLKTLQDSTVGERLNSGGRFPANFIHDGSDEVVGLFPDSKSTANVRHNKASKNVAMSGDNLGHTSYGHNDSGSASRFFKSCPYEEGEGASFAYFPKASKKDRNEGCEELEKKAGGSNAKGYTEDVAKGVDRNRPVANFHPTVKPTSLMQYLVRLVTPKGGTVLDPFMGSGSTGKACVLEGFDFIGIELDPEYCKIAEARINHNLSSLDKPKE